MGDQRPLHRRPRHTVGAGDLGLAAALGHRDGDRVAPSRRRVVVGIPAGTCPTCSVNVCWGQSTVRHRQRRLRHSNTTGQPPQARSLGRVHTHSLGDVEICPQPGTPARLRINGDQPHDLFSTQTERDTLHRQPGQSPQTRRITTMVIHGPWLSSRYSKITARITESRATLMQARRTTQPGQDRKACYVLEIV